MGRIALCADRESLMRPALLGLDEDSLDGRDWLVLLAGAAEARAFIAERAHAADIEEAWIVGCDDLVGVNLAAALRKDMPDLPIFLIVLDANGSELSRASQAGVTGTLSPTAFCRRYDAEVRRRSVVEEAVSLELDPDDVRDGGVATEGADVASMSSRIPEVLTRRGDGCVVSFLSGSGGVGKSAIAAVAAQRAAARGLATVVVDGDLQFGDLRQVMGASDAMTVDDVLADPGVALASWEAAEEGAPVLVAAPVRLERAETLAGSLGELLGLCSSFFDVVFVNTGAHWTESHAQLLEQSAASVFLMDQRASSVHACRHALELCMRLGIASAPFAFALNRCRRGALFSAIDVANAMQGAHVFEIKDGGPEVEEMLGAGLAAELAATKNDFCASVDAMLDELVPAGGSARGRRAHLRERRPRKGKAKGPSRSSGADVEPRRAGRRATARRAR